MILLHMSQFSTFPNPLSLFYIRQHNVISKFHATIHSALIQIRLKMFIFGSNNNVKTKMVLPSSVAQKVVRAFAKLCCITSFSIPMHAEINNNNPMATNCIKNTDRYSKFLLIKT